MSFNTRSRTPSWPPEPGYTRETIAGVIVEWTGTRPTPAEVQAQHSPTPAQVTTAYRVAASTMMTAIDANGIRQRAESIQTFRYIKAIADRDAAWRAVFAAANNFADLKARVAAMPVMPVPTRADHKAAVLAIISTDDPAG